VYLLTGLHWTSLDSQGKSKKCKGKFFSFFFPLLGELITVQSKNISNKSEKKENWKIEPQKIETFVQMFKFRKWYQYPGLSGLFA
jgi:hypothetical protein